MGAGEGALDVPEQLALEQLRREGTAVNGDEARRPATALVDGAGDQLLAGSGLPLDQTVERRGATRFMMLQTSFMDSQVPTTPSRVNRWSVSRCSRKFSR